MELVEARGATQQPPSGQDSPNPENNWSQVSTVTRGHPPPGAGGGGSQMKSNKICPQ